jgi:tetratricopeptide (TPR) repeat protein
MKKLAVFLLLLALPAFAAASAADGTPEDVDVSTVEQVASPPPGSLDSSKIRLDAQDAPGALADAEIALSKGGGADAYAARGDAKRALGRPVDEAIADYAEAAKLDPRYIERWKGLIAQKASEAHPDLKTGASKGLNGVPVATIATAAIVGVMLIAAAVAMLQKRAEHPLAPDDEAIKTGGLKNAAGDGPQVADDENPVKPP